MKQERFDVYHGMDEEQTDKIATLIFQDGKLVDTESEVPEGWTPETFGKKYLGEIKGGFTLDQFRAGHSSLVVVPEGS